MDLLTISGFFNGIIAYGVSFIRGSLESWRVLFLLEGGLTLLVAIVALIVLPEDVPTFKFLTAEEKDYSGYKSVTVANLSHVYPIYGLLARDSRDQLEACASSCLAMAAVPASVYIRV